MKMVEQDKLIFTAYPEFNPINKLRSIAAELIEKKFKGTVVFDLLVFNGNEINRFVTINFDGTKFDKKNINYSAHIEAKLEFTQNDFFIRNNDLLLASVLSSSEVENFKY